MYHHLQDPALQHMVQQIVKAVCPEKIYLVGATQLRQHDCTVFTQQPVTAGYTNSYLWLVLIDTIKAPGIHAIQDKIEQLSACHIPVLSWVITSASFASRLEATDFFACTIHHTAPLCYNSNNTFFHAPAAIPMPDTIYTTALAYTHRACELLAGVELYVLRRQHALAALLLHQSAEQLLTAIIYRSTGYRPQTHNIERLYQYARFVCQPLEDTWPIHTQAGREQLRHLNKAYIETRYGTGYSIRETELRCISEKLQQLQTLVAA